MKPSRGNKPKRVESVRIIRETIVAMCRVDEKRDAEEHGRVPPAPSGEERVE